MKTYEKKKERARQLAKDWQCGLINTGALNRSWAYYVKWAYLFEKIGRKYGLLREFRENGVI